MLLRSLVLPALLLVSACARTPLEDPNSPEGVYRAFMFANLTGDRAKIEPLIVPHPKADLLWGGTARFPPGVIDALSRQYREMQIHRMSDTADLVVLKSTAAPVPMQMQRSGGIWRIDVSPMIKFREGRDAAPPSK
jgi:hypothetical protein